MPSMRVMQDHVGIGDPHINSDNRSRLGIMAHVFEALVCRTDTGGYVAGLAERWQLSDDAYSWEFTLREARFHDGSSLHAADVVASLCRVRDEDLPGELGTGGVYRSYLAGSSIQALDSHRVSVRSAEPMADLLDILVALPIVPAHSLEHLPQQLIGSGRYRLDSWDAQQVSLQPFADYWGQAAELQQLDFIAEANPEARLEALLSGQVDFINHVPIAQRPLLAQSGHLVSAPSSVCTTLMFNLQRDGLCQDKRLRQALNYGIDIQAVLGRILPDAAQAINGPFSRYNLGFDPQRPPYPHNPSKAKALLAEAGYQGETLHIDVPTRIPDEAPEVTELLREQLESIGVDLQLHFHQDRSAYADMVRAKKLQDAAFFDSSPMSSYRLIREKFHSEVQALWWLGYHNDEVNAAFAQAQRSPDLETRRRLYQRMQHRIHDDAPWLFLYNPYEAWGVGAKAKGWQPQPGGLLVLA